MMSRRTNRKYELAFKTRLVAEVFEKKLTLPRIAKREHMPRETLKVWVDQTIKFGAPNISYIRGKNRRYSEKEWEPVDKLFLYYNKFNKKYQV